MSSSTSPKRKSEILPTVDAAASLAMAHHRHNPGTPSPCLVPLDHSKNSPIKFGSALKARLLADKLS